MKKYVCPDCKQFETNEHRKYLEHLLECPYVLGQKYFESSFINEDIEAEMM